MSEFTDESKISTTLAEFATREIPDGYDLWSAMRDSARPIAARLEAQSPTVASHAKEPTPAFPSRSLSRRPVTADVVSSPTIRPCTISSNNRTRSTRRWFSFQAVMVVLVMVLAVGGLLLYAGVSSIRLSQGKTGAAQQLPVPAVTVAPTVEQVGKQGTAGAEETPQPAPKLPAELKHAAEMVGTTAPDFTLSDVRTDLPFTFSSLRGKPVVLSIWDTRCPPCQELATNLQQLYDVYSSRAEFVSISFSRRDTSADVAALVAQKGYKWTFVHAADMKSLPYAVDAVPVTYFVDAQGTIRAEWVGSATPDLLKEKLGAVLHGQPAP